MKTKSPHTFQTFLRADVECALWSSTDENGEPLDGLDAELSYSAQIRFARDCKDFIAGNAEALDAYVSERDWESAGHDFWLTRNGHGAGFWDRGLGQLGRALTDASKPYGPCDLYVGDDGKIYAS